MLQAFRTSCRFEFAGRQTHARNEQELFVRHARVVTIGVVVGASTPPARSTETITCAPRRTRTRNFTARPANTPAGRTDGSATHASYVFPFASVGRSTLRTASPVGAITSCPAAPFSGT